MIKYKKRIKAFNWKRDERMCLRMQKQGMKMSVIKLTLIIK